MAYQKEGFGPRKTFIRRAYFCTSLSKHSQKIKLEKYREKTHNKIKRYLYICPTCRDLYFKSATHCVPMYLGEESIIIANIDSPQNNSIECPNCGKTAVRANPDGQTNKHYFCNDCFTFVYTSEKEIDGEKRELQTWFPAKRED